MSERGDEREGESVGEIQTEKITYLGRHHHLLLVIKQMRTM